MDNKELLILFPDLRHGWFDTKIKKPMEPYLHDSSNVISMNAITANAMKKSKLGEAGLHKNNLFSSSALEEIFCSDNALSLMTHKYRGSQQSSREVLPNLLIRHKGRQRILVSLNNGVVNSAAPGNRLARKILSVATVL